MRASLAMISEQWIGTPTINPVDSRPADLQTEPSPVVEILTPHTKCKLMENDLAYCKKKLELQPMHSELRFMQNKTLRMTLFEDPDSSDDESDDDFDDAGTNYDSNTSDENWVPDEDEVESHDGKSC